MGIADEQTHEPERTSEVLSTSDVASFQTGTPKLFEGVS